jgi:hypothetical protein
MLVGRLRKTANIKQNECPLIAFWCERRVVAVLVHRRRLRRREVRNPIEQTTETGTVALVALQLRQVCLVGGARLCATLSERHFRNRSKIDYGDNDDNDIEA